MDRMRKNKFTEEQIAMALRQGEAGTPVTDICCRKLDHCRGAPGVTWTPRNGLYKQPIGNPEFQLE